MKLEAAVADIDPAYWLNWRVLLCAISVLASISVASYIIWKYECSKCSDYDQGETANIGLFLRNEEAWRPCLKQIQPIWLMAFRITSFSLLLTTLVIKAIKHGGHIFFFYTQYSFSLFEI